MIKGPGPEEGGKGENKTGAVDQPGGSTVWEELWGRCNVSHTRCSPTTPLHPSIPPSIPARGDNPRLPHHGLQQLFNMKIDLNRGRDIHTGGTPGQVPPVSRGDDNERWETRAELTRRETWEEEQKYEDGEKAKLCVCACGQSEFIINTFPASAQCELEARWGREKSECSSESARGCGSVVCRRACFSQAGELFVQVHPCGSARKEWKIQALLLYMNSFSIYIYKKNEIKV